MALAYRPLRACSRDRGVGDGSGLLKLEVQGVAALGDGTDPRTFTHPDTVTDRTSTGIATYTCSDPLRSDV